MPALAPAAYDGRYTGPNGVISPNPSTPESVRTRTTVLSKTVTDLPPDQL